MDLRSEDRERPERYTENHENWEMFAAAVIKAAVDDYKAFSSKGRQGIERFFRSEYFRILSDIDAEWLIKSLREMYPVGTGTI